MTGMYFGNHTSVVGHNVVNFSASTFSGFIILRVLISPSGNGVFYVVSRTLTSFTYSASVLNITSLGQLEKKMENTDYDTLHHLFLVIQTKNVSFVVEKNEVIQIYKFKSLGKGTETLFAPSNAGLTLNEMRIAIRLQ